MDFASGRFFVGCNYWASHAGMFMWRNWDEAQVEDDMRRMSESGLTVLRVFPLWNDFQPIRRLYGGCGSDREVRRGEEPLDESFEGRAGMDPVMLERFSRFCDLAEKYHLSLLVGLLTGWMSGRLFIPEALYGRNVLTDPEAIMWETRFVRVMVRRFRDKKAVFAWDLGNECNCMGEIGDHAAAYAWTSAIADAIRSEDAVRPIVSGMHSLTPDGAWRMQDQGENLDILTTHPYPLFTPHCDTDPMNRMKSALHAASESLYYAGIGHKPCFAEEQGVLGPMIVGDEYAADYIRASLFTLWASDCRGMLWWCGFDQIELEQAPYDWNGLERELGLFRTDRTPKPALREIGAFGRFVNGLPFDTLPPRITDAVCVLTRGQDTWAAAYGSAILAKQAGLDITYAYAGGDIPDAPCYILPCLEGDGSLSRGKWMAILDRVRNGAKLYLSVNGAQLSPFRDFTGLRVLYRSHKHTEHTPQICGETVRVSCDWELVTESCGARVTVYDDHARPLFAENAYGKGTVYTLLSPIERDMAVIPGATDGEEARNACAFYRMLGMRSPEKTAQIQEKCVGLTEHVLPDGARVLIAVNYSAGDVASVLTLKEGYAVKALYCVHGNCRIDGNVLTLPHNDGCVIVTEKK